MQKNLYFKHVYGRKNLLMEFFYELFLKLSSYPRMVIEVIIRRNFGERYFSLTAGIVILAILIWLPSASEVFTRDFFTSNFDRYAWYLFSSLFAGSTIVHWWDTVRTPGVFDFSRFSKYAGDIHPLFRKINLWGWTPDDRMIETLLEPALFFGAGLFLNSIGFALGTLLIVVSVFYSVSYLAAYHKGDDFVMDRIDEAIMNEEMENAFVYGKSSEETRGVKFYAQKPKLRAERERIAKDMIHDPSKVEFTIAE